MCATLLFLSGKTMNAQMSAVSTSFDINAAEWFANLALACVHKEFPIDYAYATVIRTASKRPT